MELKQHITDERTGISYTLCERLVHLNIPTEEEKYIGILGAAAFAVSQAAP